MIRQYLEPGGYVVSLQNCMNEETIAGITETVYKTPPRRYEHLADRKSRQWSGTPRGKRSYCERIRHRVPIRFPASCLLPTAVGGSLTNR